MSSYKKVSVIFCAMIMFGCASVNLSPNMKSKESYLYGDGNRTNFDTVFAYYVKEKNISNDSVLFYILSDYNKNKEYKSLTKVKLPTDELFLKEKNNITEKIKALKPNYSAIVGLAFNEYQNGKGLQVTPELEMAISNPNWMCDQYDDDNVLGTGTCGRPLKWGGARSIAVKLKLDKWFLPVSTSEAAKIQMMVTNNPKKEIPSIINYSITSCEKVQSTNNLTCDAHVNGIVFYGTGKISEKSNPIGHAVEVK